MTGLRLFIFVKEFAHFCKSSGVRRKQHISVFLSRRRIRCGGKGIPAFCKHCVSCDVVSGLSCEAHDQVTFPGLAQLCLCLGVVAEDGGTGHRAGVQCAVPAGVCASVAGPPRAGQVRAVAV